MIKSMTANARKHRGPKPDPKTRVDPYPKRLNARHKTTEITKKMATGPVMHPLDC
jgi:hypothetical protein